MVIPNLPNSENGRLRRDGNTVPNQTQYSSKEQVSDLILARTRFPVEKHEDVSGAREQRVKLTITLATRAKLPRSQSSANEIENFSEVCQTFCPLEQKVQHRPAKLAKPAVFGNWGVNQTQVPSIPSLPVSELVPIKHTLNFR